MSREGAENNSKSIASYLVVQDSDRELRLKVSGFLNADGVALLWTPTEKLVSEAEKNIYVDVSEVTLCDSTGAVYLLNLQRLAVVKKVALEFTGLRPEISRILKIFSIDSIVPQKVPDKPLKGFMETIGESTFQIFSDLKTQIVFLGQLSIALCQIVLNPRQLHIRKIFKIFQTAAVEGLPIVSLISFLVGLIIATQAAGPLRSYGAEIHVIYLVSLIMFRELSAIMTAILLAGRTGSAFAAEIGTMKINEELNALQTMGLDPIRFLVVERVLAGLLAMPFLTIYSMFVGAGASFISMLANGYSMPALYEELIAYCNVSDVMEGLLKSFFFGALVTGVGCLRGIQTKAGASSVGEAATRAVVSSIILIIASDCIFTLISTTLRGTL